VNLDFHLSSSCPRACPLLKQVQKIQIYPMPLLIATRMLTTVFSCFRHRSGGATVHSTFGDTFMEFVS
jgi:hypothetical protein